MVNLEELLSPKNLIILAVILAALAGLFGVSVFKEAGTGIIVKSQESPKVYELIPGYSSHSPRCEYNPDRLYKGYFNFYWYTKKGTSTYSWLYNYLKKDSGFSSSSCWDSGHCEIEYVLDKKTDGGWRTIKRYSTDRVCPFRLTDSCGISYDAYSFDSSPLQKVEEGTYQIRWLVKCDGSSRYGYHQFEVRSGDAPSCDVGAICKKKEYIVCDGNKVVKKIKIYRYNSVCDCEYDETKKEVLEVCDYKCEDGKCVPRPSCDVGSVCKTTENIYCSGNDLMKDTIYYRYDENCNCVKAETQTVKLQTCEYGCQNGACLSPPPGYCGDGICQDDENQITCPQDCGGTTPGPVCGNGICEPGETWENCPQDCAPSPTPIDYTPIIIALVTVGAAAGIAFVLYKKL